MRSSKSSDEEMPGNQPSGKLLFKQAAAKGAYKISHFQDYNTKSQTVLNHKKNIKKHVTITN